MAFKQIMWTSKVSLGHAHLLGSECLELSGGQKVIQGELRGGLKFKKKSVSKSASKSASKSDSKSASKSASKNTSSIRRPKSWRSVTLKSPRYRVRRRRMQSNKTRYE